MSRRRGRTNSWRGLIQPKRDTCPKCGKRGMGPLRVFALTLVGQHCRYCRHIAKYQPKPLEQQR